MTVWRPALSLELRASVRVKLFVSIHFHGLGTWWCQGSCLLESYSPASSLPFLVAQFTSVFLADSGCTSLVSQIPSFLRHSNRAQVGPEPF